MKKAILLIIFLCVAAACATVPVPPIRNAEITESNLPSKTNIEGIRPRQSTITIAQKVIVPVYVWDGTRDCYNMVFEFYRKPTYEVSSKDIVRALLLTGWDTPEYFAKYNKFNVYGFKDGNPSKSKIKYFLSQGHPVIAYLRYERRSPDGNVEYEHYEFKPVVLTGYDDTEGIFVCCSPSSGKVEKIPYKKFNELHSAGPFGYSHNYGELLYLKVRDARQIPAPKQMEPISVRQTKTQPVPAKGVDTIEKPKTSILVTPSSSTTNIVTVTWTSVNIRSGPGNNYSVAASVKQGDKLDVIGESGEWFNVRLGDGQKGWISNRVVK